ncbi:MAG: hypothetical protein U5K84_09435 [Alkalibacterium sp.]|nr:hypothetical protein [Alkalibacterium sp.]
MQAQSEQALEAAEQNIEYQEALTYEGIVSTYVVDSEGFLTEYTIKTEVNETMSRDSSVTEPNRVITTNQLKILEIMIPI